VVDVFRESLSKMEKTDFEATQAVTEATVEQKELCMKRPKWTLLGHLRTNMGMDIFMYSAADG
jgi:hypothetical protein